MFENGEGCESNENTLEEKKLLQSFAKNQGLF